MLHKFVFMYYIGINTETWSHTHITFVIYLCFEWIILQHNHFNEPGWCLDKAKCVWVVSSTININEGKEFLQNLICLFFFFFTILQKMVLNEQRCFLFYSDDVFIIHQK